MPEAEVQGRDDQPRPHPALVDGDAEANIGIATGKVSGISVVDVDIKPWKDKQGDETLRALTDKYGELPVTLMQTTWSGGMQIVFAYKDGAPNAAGCYGKWLDGRNDGGYIVAPPSKVTEGEREGTYAWWTDPRTTPLATMPSWLFEQTAQKPKSTKFAGGRKPVQQMADDGRNNALTSLAGSIRRRDAGEDTVRAALLAENARFQTPLDESEVEVIVQSAMRNFAPEPEVTVAHDHGMRATDQSYAEQLALLAGDHIRFNDESGKWYVFDGKRWAMSTVNAVIPLVTDMAKSLYRQAAAEPDADKRARLATAGARLESWRVVSGIVRLAQALPQLQVKAEAFDPDEHLMNVENGVVDLRTGELLPHDPKLMMSRLAPVAYDPGAVFPLWDETVRLALHGRPGEDRLHPTRPRLCAHRLYQRGQVREPGGRQRLQRQDDHHHRGSHAARRLRDDAAGRGAARRPRACDPA